MTEVATSTTDEAAVKTGVGYPPIEELIPHRASFRLVEEIAEEIEDGVICLGRFSPDHPYVGPGGAPQILGLELAAQAAGVHQAMQRRRTSEGDDSGEARRPAIGYLASIRRAHFEAHTLPVDRTLRAVVRREGGAGALVLYKVQVFDDTDGSECMSAVLGTYAKR